MSLAWSSDIITTLRQFQDSYETPLSLVCSQPFFANA